MDFDDRTKIKCGNYRSAEFQLRRLSKWWDENHQLAGLPHAAFCSFIDFPLATRGAVRARANGWKWWYPNCLFSLSRGGYGALFVYLRGKSGLPAGLTVEERDVKEQLEIAGNLVCMVQTWTEVVEILSDYLAGKIVRPEG